MNYIVILKYQQVSKYIIKNYHMKHLFRIMNNKDHKDMIY